MTWEFKVGQKVVCVDGVAHKKWVVTKGGLYTISGIFQEHVNVAEAEEWPVGAFYASRFRPLVTDTQSWLADILAKPPQKVTDLEHAGSGRGLL